MSTYKQIGMKVICDFDDQDWATGKAYDILDVIKNKIPKTDRKWLYKEGYFVVYGFPKNVVLMREVYSREYQMPLLLDQKSFDEVQEWLTKFDEEDPKRKPSQRVL